MVAPPEVDAPLVPVPVLEPEPVVPEVVVPLVPVPVLEPEPMVPEVVVPLVPVPVLEPDVFAGALEHAARPTRPPARTSSVNFVRQFIALLTPPAEARFTAELAPDGPEYSHTHPVRAAIEI